MRHWRILETTWDMRNELTGDIGILEIDMRHRDPLSRAPVFLCVGRPSGRRLLVLISVLKLSVINTMGDTMSNIEFEK